MFLLHRVKFENAAPKRRFDYIKTSLRVPFSRPVELRDSPVDKVRLKALVL